MPVSIPGAPQNGGALASYLSDYSLEVGWISNPTSPSSRDIRSAIDDLNDPATWVGFAAHAVSTVWASLPTQIRNVAQDALTLLVSQALAGASKALEAAGAAVSDAVGAVPIIGMIIDAVMVVIKQFLDLGEQFENEKEEYAAFRYMEASLYTFSKYEHPNDWVLRRSKVSNYLDRRSHDWFYRPSYSRAGGRSDLIFWNTAGPSDKGECGNGVEMYCGTRQKPLLGQCHKRHKNRDYCERHLMISALFYPFWSPAYPDQTSITEKDYVMSGGWGESGGGTPSVDETSNTLLMARQMALLTSPSVNLQVDANRVLKIRDIFARGWIQAAGQYGRVEGYEFPDIEQWGVLPIGHKHIVERGEGAALIDAREEKNFSEPSTTARKFYFDKVGLIHAYRTSDKLGDWGVPTWQRGPHTPVDAAISCAQYNTVLSAVLSFMSARANFLRNGAMMKTLVNEFGADHFDRHVRDAMKYAADVGGPLPPFKKSAPDRAKTAPDRAAPDRWSGGGGGAGAVAGVAGLVGLLAYLKWGRSG